MPGPLQVSALTAGDTLLKHFWDLASLEEDKRENAARALVQELVQNQREFEESSEGSDDEEDDKAGGRSAVDRALRRCSPLMVYAFKRLCRGLGSSRQGARQGFSLAITSLLGSTGCIRPAEAVAAVEGVLEPAGKGTELRDALLGRIFGYAAVARSGVALPADLAVSMAAGLVAAAEKKSFLREVAGAVLLELCQAVDDAVLQTLVSGPQAPLAPWLTAPAADADPEALLLALRLWPRLPPAAAAACPLLPAGVKPKQLPPSLFADPAAAVGSKPVAAAAAAFFTRKHLAELLPVLRATTLSHPRLHSVWPTLLALLIPGFSADKEQRTAAGVGKQTQPAAPALEAFWSVVVDGDLVQSSHERKYLALTLFLLLLPHLGPQHVPLVFTPAFLRCLATNLKKGDSYLHAGAKKCMERIATYCDKAAPEVRIAVGLAMQRHGGGGLEKYAKAAQKGAAAAAAAATEGADKPGGGKTGDAAAAVAEGKAAEQAEGLQQYVKQLQDAFLQAGASAAAAAAAAQAAEDGEGAEGGTASAGAGGTQQLQWAIEQLCGVLKQAAASAEAKHSVLRFLAAHALFSVDAAAAKKSNNAGVKSVARCVDIPLAQRQLCAARLISLADSLDKQQQQHPQAGKGGHKQQEQQQGQQPPAAAQQQQQQQEYVSSVAAFVSKLRQSGVAQLATAAAGEEAAAEQAEAAAASLEGALQRLQARLATGGAAATAPREQQRLRALAHLLRLLLLHTLAEPAGADASLAADLAAVYSVAVEGEVAPLGAAGLRRGGSADGSEEEGDSEEEGGSEEEGDGGDEEMADVEGEGDGAEAPPHWHDTLMDVLLSLLAHNAAPLPSAPLRDAVEHVFRAFADDLTPTGMQDMLRVLSKPLDSGAQTEGEDVYASSDEEEEGEEEGGEAGSDEEGSDLEEEEEEGGSSSEEEEEEGTKPAGAGKGAAAAAGSESDAEEEEAGGSSSDDEGMSDEAMFRMDSKLASYFATLKEGRSRGAAARSARDELINFKMRVAGLLEAFCKRVPGSPLLPSAVAPLLSGLAGASRAGGHQTLAERLSGLINNRLCSSKAEASGAAGLAGEEVEQQLRRTLYLASRATDKRVATAACSCYVYLQRAAAASPDAECREKGAESARAALLDFFTKKKSRLQRTLLEGLARRVPVLVPEALLPEALRRAAEARNEFLQAEAFALLASLLKTNGAAVASALGSCSPAAAAAVLAAACGKFSKPQRQAEALKVACLLAEAASKGGHLAAAAAGSSGKAGKKAGPGWGEVRAAVERAADVAAGIPKLSAALQRLEKLLGEAPTGAVAAKPAAAAGGKQVDGAKAAKAAATPGGTPLPKTKPAAATPGGKQAKSAPASGGKQAKPAATPGGEKPATGSKPAKPARATPSGAGGKRGKPTTPKGGSSKKQKV